MFGLAAGLYDRVYAQPKISIVLVGCDNAGKTALLERCKVTKWTNSRSAGKKISHFPKKARIRQDSLSDASVGNGRTLNSDDMQDRLEMQYHMKEGKKMFPLHKITPTIGMNIAKLVISECKIVMWDLSGGVQMRLLWERYYADCDGLIFVLDASNPAKLKEARECFLTMQNHDDLRDVPMLIFANKMDKEESAGIMLKEWAGVLGEKGVRIQGGSAKTGAGVRDAFESVIILAKEALLERDDILQR